MLKVENVIKMYGTVRAVNGAQMEVMPGEVVLVSGPSGCGKTVLLRLISGLERPSSGRVEAIGREISSLPEHKAAAARCSHMGIMASGMGFLREYSMVENIAMPLNIRGMGKRKRLAQAMAMMDQMGIRRLAPARPGSILPPEARLAALARAAIGGPELLLLDEPLSGATAQEAETFWNAVRALVEPRRAVIIFSTDPCDALRPDRAYAMREGILMEAIRC